ncbi:MAG: hypothetical protein GY743_03615 [Planctomycetaceae bacterium]|nr:hypothetical protein [Planctomycetaceae bacterium]
MKELILRDLTKPEPGETYIIDGLPMRICKFARARRCKLFQGVASFGYCVAQKQTYYGFEGHFIVATNGEIRAFALSAANADERETALDMVETYLATCSPTKAMWEPISHRKWPFRA